MFRSSVTAAEWLLRPQLAAPQITALRTAKQIKLKLPKGYVDGHGQLEHGQDRLDGMTLPRNLTRICQTSEIWVHGANNMQGTTTNRI